MRTSTLLAIAIMALAPTWAAAEVTDSSPNGFTIKLAIAIQAPPADVYQRLIHNVGDWWSSAHTIPATRTISASKKSRWLLLRKTSGGGSVRHWR